MHEICHYIDFNIANMQNICIKYAYICIKYAFNMHKYAFNMHKYAFNMDKHASNMHQICIKYAENMQKICHYIDFIIANMQITCKKYAKSMLNMQQKCAKKCAINMQNMHKSMYWHIVYIYALPTLLMVLKDTLQVYELCSRHMYSKVYEGTGGGKVRGMKSSARVTKHLENLESDEVISAVLLSCVTRGDKRCG